MKKIFTILLLFNFLIASAQVNNALNFDGIDDEVILDPGISLYNRSFTVEFWAKKTALNRFDIIFSQGSQGSNINQHLHMGFRDNNKFTFGFYGNDLDVPASYTDLAWHHWACTYDNNTKERIIYLDGTQVARDISSSSFFPSSARTLIGNAAFATPSFYGFKGSLDELRIWNRPLTRLEISFRRSCNINITAKYGDNTGLIGYYKFNQGLAGGNNYPLTVVTDSSPENIAGTARNFTSIGPTSNWVAGTAQTSTCQPYPEPVITSYSPTSGPAGTKVTIAGSVLTTTTGVSIAGAPATLSLVNNYNYVEAISNVPIGEPIIVTTAGGTATANNQLLPIYGDNINYQVVFVKGSGVTGSKPFNNYVIKAEPDVDGVATTLVSSLKGFNNKNINLCYNYQGTGATKNTTILTETGSSRKAYDLNILSWNADNANCTYGANDVAGNNVTVIKTIVADKPSVFTTYNVNGSNGASATLKHVWRYIGGTLDNPLLFDSADTFKKRFHINSNRSAPEGANANMGYVSNIFSPSPEVAYTLNLDTSTMVKISTNFPETNFNTSIYVIRAGDTAALFKNDDISATNNKSELTINLCSGFYTIIVEGSSATDVGDFKLSVEKNPYKLIAGDIKLDGGGTIPHIQEGTPLQIVTNTTNASGGYTQIRWQQREGELGLWKDADSSTNTQLYKLPKNLSLLTGDVYYRRVVYDMCSSSASNSVLVKFVKPEGHIEGVVKSKNGKPVKGVTLTLERKTQVPGSPNNYTRTATTNDLGKFSFPSVYFGVPNANNIAFVVTPAKGTHEFDPRQYPLDLTSTNYSIKDISIVDKTALTISGKVIQECESCIKNQNEIYIPTAPLADAEIYINNQSVPLTKSQKDGTYTFTVDDPDTYKVTPKYKNHKFLRSDTTININENVNNINFKDTSTHTISGRISAGCGEFIGEATLEFYNTMPFDSASGSYSTSFFRKQVSTNSSGYYTVRLPARQYAAKVVTFKPAIDVTIPDFNAFFEMLPIDSLTRDITTNDAVLNFVYERRPTVVFDGINIINCSNSKNYSLAEQGKKDSLYIKVYQGNTTCPVKNAEVTIVTNVQKEPAETFALQTNEIGMAKLVYIPGLPNINPAPTATGPGYSRFVEVLVKDKFKRPDADKSITHNIVVTGVKPDDGIPFVTTSPQIPLMVLHAPPGDGSSSSFERTKSTETAIRFFSANAKEQSAWSEVKLGVKYEAGIILSSETAFWGLANGAIAVNSTNTSSNEAIVTNTFSQNISTGQGGDVFIGAALNLTYSVATEITYNSATCSVISDRKLIVAANNGFNTTFNYSENHIKNKLIPQLDSLAARQTTEVARNRYLNQKNVWQQVLDNNERNKRMAPFVKNVSFDGGVGGTSESTTTTSTQSNTIEFALEIDKSIEAEVGMEIGGSGFRAGYTANFKMETGSSTTNTQLNETVTSYILQDDDLGDDFTVNVRRDPVYNTPVFELVGGTSSCPYEPGTQSRDAVELSVDKTIVTNIPTDGEAIFTFLLGNTSPSQETRDYKFSFDQSSNGDGATVLIGGSPATKDGITYSVAYLRTQKVTVVVKKGNPADFSYEDLQFTISSDCEGGISKTVSLSAFFQTPCSNITLTSPEAEWVVAKADNNVVPINFKDYQINELNKVTLQYSKSKSNLWTDAFTLDQSQISNSVNGTSTNWNVANLADGAYKLRLVVGCSQSVRYTPAITGTIDRTPPEMIGNPEPSDKNYVLGDRISATYSEELDCSAITAANVVLQRVSNGALIPAQLGCYQNKISIVPLVNLANFTGEGINIRLKNIPDIYGNTNSTISARAAKTTEVATSWNILIGQSAAATGNKAISVFLNRTSVMEDVAEPLTYKFTLPVPAVNDMLINYTVAGTALHHSDFSISYGADVQTSLSNTFNGTQGSIVMKSGQKTATLIVLPTKDNVSETDEIVTVSLNTGGDYLIGNNATATGTILNDDMLQVYTFNGNGNWTDAANWSNGMVPPVVIPQGVEVIIDPATNGVCELNAAITISTGAKLTVKPGKNFKVNGKLK